MEPRPSLIANAPDGAKGIGLLKVPTCGNYVDLKLLRVAGLYPAQPEDRGMPGNLRAASTFLYPALLLESVH